MKDWLEIIVCILFLILVYQDFKNREVNVYVLSGIFLCNGFITYREIGFQVFVLFSINILIVTFLIVGLMVYSRIKNKTYTKMLDNEFGRGDLATLVAITPLFLPLNLLIVIIFSVVLSILVSLPLNIKKIPFAGFVSITLIFYLILNKFNQVDGLIRFVSV